MSQSGSEAQARNFDCHSCPTKIKAHRRCGESRMDFTDKDGSFWPIQLNPGGALYNFCPAKATWDPMARETFSILTMSLELGCLYNAGGLSDQPDWYIELMTFFAPIYDKLKFIAKAQMILGSGKKTPKVPGRR